MPARGKEIGADALRVIVIAAAVNGGARLMPAEASTRPVVDLSPIQEEIAQLRRDIGADLRDHDRRLAALERAP